MTIKNQEARLYTTPPAEPRSPREMQVYQFLDRMQIPYERLDHEATASYTVCNTVEQQLGIQISKNLFLCTRKKDRYYLLMLPGTKQFVSKEVSAQLGSSRLSFGNPEDLEQLLNVLPGSVSVFGLLFDKEKKVQLLIDRDIVNSRYVGCHPCENTSSLKIKTKDLLEILLPEMGYTPIVIDL